MKGKIDYIPPTYRPVKAIYEEADGRIKELIDKNDDDLVTVEDLMIFASAMSEHLSGDDRKIVAEFIGSALVNVERLLEMHPESKSLIMSTAVNLILAGLRSAEDLVIKICTIEMNKARPFLKANSPKAALMERAEVIAAELWAADTQQVIRVGDMSEKVYRLLVREGFEKGREGLPGDMASFRKGIKPVAPSYARKGGATKKT